MVSSRPRPIFFSLLAAVFLAPLAIAFQSGPRVGSFSPQGTVKRVRQVQVRFSHPMVPFGDPRQTVAPFSVDCAAEGTGRWADVNHWIYDFRDDLPAGVSCEFRLKSGVTTLEGAELQGQRVFRFSTGGPAVIRSRPWEGATIEEDQIFVLELDAPATPRSVLQHAYFTVEGSVERVGVRIVEGELRQEILDSTYSYRERQRQLEDRLLLLKAKLTFPQDSRVDLVWGAGIEAATGIATSEDQVLPFRTRRAFFAEFHCTRENEERPCVPLTPMRVELSAPISREDARQFQLTGPEGRRRDPVDPNSAWVSRVVFKEPFPAESVFELSLPPELHDNAGRPLINQSEFPLLVKTGELPPLAKFSARFGVLESGTGGILPVTVRNLEADLDFKELELEQSSLPGRTLKASSDDAMLVLGWLRHVHQNYRFSTRDRSIFEYFPEPSPEQEEAEAVIRPPAKHQAPSWEALKGADVASFTLPKPNGAKAFEVMGIPLGAPGFYVVELESRILGEALLGKPKPMFVPTTALVTNLAVHFKWGIENSLVWVTRLDSGSPAPDVRIQVWDCEGKLVGESRTDPEGLAWMSDIPAPDDAPNCSWKDYDNGLFVTARSQEDFSFVHSSWDEGIEPWRYQLPTQWNSDLVAAETVFDRPLFRAGETVHMKHLIRRRAGRGFSLLDPRELPVKLRILHQGSRRKYEQAIQFDGSGIAESSWKIPGEAALGTYSVQLLGSDPDDQDDYGQKNRWYAGSFRVEEFRVPLMRGHLRWPESDPVAPEQVPADLSVEYLGGGPASKLPVTFRYQVRPGFGRSFDDFGGFRFANGPVQEGVFRAEENRPSEQPPMHRETLELNSQGSARMVLDEIPELEEPALLQAEMEFRDPNGQVQTVSSSLRLWTSSLLVGIRPDSWAASAETLQFKVAVVDLQGKPVANVPVTVDAFRSTTQSHRKRLVGGFYAYEHMREVTRLATVCEGVTNSKGLLECGGKAPESGNLLLQASIQDPEGRDSFARHGVWVASHEDWWFEVSDDDRIDLLPEENRYEPGEEAVFQVRMPFREGTALVSVEREGIIRAFVQPLSGRAPLLRVPVEPTDAPNVFVSALVVRGRISGVQPTALVDLGKPAFKLGIAQIQVGWEAHRLEVKVSTDRPVYQVRETAVVDVEVKRSTGGPLPADAEIAVAAVDEGLLELLPNRSWDLLDNMMGRRRYGVQTSTAQMQVVGKRHFGLKALPQGGGGGRSATRDLFDTLLLWKGRVPLYDGGRARIEVPLNDSLTSFRIVAVANAGPDLFGSGSTTIRSTQDLILFSGIPPLVRSGDEFDAGFTLRNATDRELTVQVRAAVQPEALELPGRRVSLPGGESRLISWRVTAPDNSKQLRYRVEVNAEDTPGDSLEVTQRVIPAVPVRTLQATLAQPAPDFSASVRIPEGAIEGRGGLRLHFSPTLTAGLDPVREYMRDYPYSCLEQVTSRAVALNEAAQWEKISDVLPAFLDGDGLAKYFPTALRGSDTLTAYLLSVVHQRGWEVPEVAREPMLDALTRFVDGRLSCYTPLPTTDLALRKLAALEAISRYRPVESKMLESIALHPNLWPTSGVIDWLMLLYRTPGLPRREAWMDEAEQILRARLNFQGTTMGFSTESRDRLWWLMVSPDLNATRLVLALLESERWGSDLPRLMVGAMDRRRRGHWDVTTANAWGILAAEAFAARFERDPVTGSAVAKLAGGESRTWDWNRESEGGSVDFDWPASGSHLTVLQQGSGTPWLSLQSRAALPLREPLSSGYHIRRTVTPVQQKVAGVWSVGDVARVRLELEAQADMTWVVVDDPIPAGSNILGSGLGGDSRLLTRGERDGGAWPVYEERSFEAFRAYYSWVPKGTWSVEYTVRFNNAGRFQLPPTRVDALYHPEFFGATPNAAVEVKP